MTDATEPYPAPKYAALSAIEAGDLLADRAYSQLSTAILRNHLSPGASLSVVELARHLGISRSPVREAVQRLIWDGLADYRGRRGTVVVSIDLNDFLRLLEVREALEALAARLAAQRGSTEERDELRGIQQEFESLGSADLGRLGLLRDRHALSCRDPGHVPQQGP